MFSLPYIPARVLALFLPIALLWAFTGCVQSCSEQAEGTLEHRTIFAAETNADKDDCRECPLLNAPSCGLRGRSSWVHNPGDAPQVVSLLRGALDRADHSATELQKQS